MDNRAGSYVWSEYFDSIAADAAALENRIARRVASSIAMTMRTSERIVQDRSENAYNAYLRAVAHYDRYTQSDLSDAAQNLKEALIWNPQYSSAHALLAAVYWTSWQNRWRIAPHVTTKTTLVSAQTHLERAHKPTAIAHAVIAEMLTESGHHAEAIAEAEKAIVLEPDTPIGYYAKGLALIFDGRHAEAEYFIRAAMQINPHGQRYMFGLALAEYSMERFNSALTTLTRATTRNPEDDWSFLLLATTYGHLRQADEARAALSSFDTLSLQRRGWSSTHLPYVISWPFRYDRDRQRLHEGMMLAGIESQFRVAVRQ